MSEGCTTVTISIPRALLERLDAPLRDHIRNRIQYGTRSKIIVKAIELYLAQRESPATKTLLRPRS